MNLMLEAVKKADVQQGTLSISKHFSKMSHLKLQVGISACLSAGVTAYQHIQVCIGQLNLKTLYQLSIAYLLSAEVTAYQK